MKTAICIAMMVGMNLMAQAPTVILGTDLVSTSRETINSNFLGLYNQKATTADCSGTPGTFITVLTPTTATCTAAAGSGVTSVGATAPLTSSGGTTPTISATYQGNGSKVQLSSGTTTTGHCANYDASGNIVDAGSPCGTGSGSVSAVTATAPLTSSGGGTPNISATYQGNGSKIQLETGSTTTGHCVTFDSNGNVVDCGFPYGRNTLTPVFNNSLFVASIDGRQGSTAPDPATMRNHINDSTGGMGNIAVSGTLAVPAGTTTVDADAVFGQVTNLSAVTSAVAGSFWCQSRIANAWCFGLNPLVSDFDPVSVTNVAAHLRGAEWDINIANTGTTVEGQLFGGATSVQPASSHAITFGSMGNNGSSTIPWDIGIWGYPGAISTYGILLDAAGPCLVGGCTMRPSQSIQLWGRDGIGLPLPMVLDIDASGNGSISASSNIVFSPSGGTAGSFTSLGLEMAASHNIYDTQQRSTTGQRYVCITTAGELVSSAAACVGT